MSDRYEIRLGRVAKVYPDGKYEFVTFDMFDEQQTDYVLSLLESETAPLQTELATLQSALSEQSATIVRMRQELDAAAQLLQEANERATNYAQSMVYALESLSPYLNANSPYTPDVLEAASFLSKALESKESGASKEALNESETE